MKNLRDVFTQAAQEDSLQGFRVGLQAVARELEKRERLRRNREKRAAGVYVPCHECGYFYTLADVLHHPYCSENKW